MDAQEGDMFFWGEKGFGGLCHGAPSTAAGRDRPPSPSC